MVAITHHSTS